MGLFLTSIELEELTGYKHTTKQVAWLQCRGYFVESNARGIPRVTYTQIEDMRRLNTPINFQFNEFHQIHQSLPNITKKQSICISEPNMQKFLQKITKTKPNG